MLLKSQLQWARHVSRMGGGHRLPKIALYGELSTGYRERGAPKKRFKDSLKKTFSTCHMDQHQWLILAADCQAWRYTVHQVISTFEDFRRANLREKCHNRKIQGASAAIPGQTFSCGQTFLCYHQDLIMIYVYTYLTMVYGCHNLTWWVYSGPNMV